ncbi:MAG: CdaR family protein [Ignavibacteria bacterium]
MKKNLRIFILSFVFALALWLYINLNLSYSLSISIPVEVQTGKSQALIEEIPNSIDVKVKGKGWDLLNLIISKDLKYNLDISKLKKDTKIITGQYVNESLDLQPNVSILEISPDTININFDKVFEKLVPVRNNIKVKLKEGYDIIGSPVLNPDSVKIQGASYIVNKMKYIPTEEKIINNVNSDISGVVNIKDTLPNLIRINKQQVSYSYNIQLSAEKNFDEVYVNVTNVPDDKEVLLIPPRISLSLRGGVEQLTQIGSSDIKSEIEFGKIESDTLGFIIPEIIIPDGTSLLKYDPQKLQYIIKNKQ